LKNLNKLRWRCRRGTLELDLMLTRYLERCFVEADPAEQAAFLQLLTLEDSELMRYLMGEQRADDPALRALVLRIRTLPA